MYQRIPTIKSQTVYHSVKTPGGKLNTVRTREGQIALDDGNLVIPCGGYNAFENINYRRLQKNRDRHLESETKKLVKRIESLNSMGIASTYNRLFAPLQEMNKSS